MESLPRVAYGPSPPPQSAKGRSRALRSIAGLPHAASQHAMSAARSAPSSSVSAAAPPRTRESRQLVEGYWQSVWQSRHDAPLYHTYSDRYGGTRGVPYASRQHESARRDAALTADAAADVPACLARADEAFCQGRLSDAQAQLEHVLTLLQNAAESHGVLTVAALTQLRGTTAADQQRAIWLAEVLRRLGTMELIRGQYATARGLFDGSIAADPLYLDTYLLRASCCEALRCFAEAHEDYAKYMKMTEPSMEVLAHSGKCAAEAGLVEVARAQLSRLLQLAQEVLQRLGSAEAATETAAAAQRQHLQQLSASVPPLTSASWAAGTMTLTMNGAVPSSLELLRCACEFYVAHAHFYLGYVAEGCASAVGCPRSEVNQLRQHAAQHYRTVLRNTDYVQTYESSVTQAMAAGDFALARHLLGYLQRMNAQRADYFLDTARACRAEGDVHGELCALSAALDRTQTVAERRATLLARGAVYADELRDWSRAIRDFSLLLILSPGSPAQVEGEAAALATADAEAGAVQTAEEVDWSTPLALVRRALAYRQRHADTSRSELLRREDEAAALVDYAAFLSALVDVCAAAGISQQAYVASDAVPPLCRPSEVISALLVLANGAYRSRQYASTVEYFSRAIALGWEPATPCAVLPPSERLADQLYLSLAHHVMSLYPLGEEMFRAPYEAREAVTVAVSSGGSAPGEARRSTKTATQAGSRSSGAEGERGGFAHPPLLYVVVDQHYQRLRALEPTFFAAIEDAFLDAWEPYHTEVERLREDTLSSRAGRRGKR